ncbi:MAG: 16S rRNA (cytosine(1402)-N(4))-methyltransferase RsmH [Chitinophagaceae bacterium]|nr:16S rRNA (cytosine(1402)-N(4))-methyltransferase RsmH [Chitinophagaceae bacterium]
MNQYHIPVLLNELIDGLTPKPDGIYVDATYGGGGHSQALLSRLSSKGKIYAFDIDNDVTKNSIDDERITYIRGNFRYVKRFLRFHNVSKIDGLFADLGVSSYQIDTLERGFSTRFHGALDMRMNQESEVSAKEVLHTYSSDKLCFLFKNYGEMQRPKDIAQAICSYRINYPLETTEDFKTAIQKFAPRGKENQFFAQAFQSIRIEVNQELESLKELLMQSPELLLPGGKLAIISYHSLEDRLVKNFIGKGNLEGIDTKDFYGNKISYFTPMHKKPIYASEQEIQTNKRSRSAKLRIGILHI